MKNYRTNLLFDHVWGICWCLKGTEVTAFQIKVSVFWYTCFMLWFHQCMIIYSFCPYLIDVFFWTTFVSLFNTLCLPQDWMTQSWTLSCHVSDFVYEIIQRFIDDALSEGIPVAILAAYGRNGEKISRYGLYKNKFFKLLLFVSS